MIPATRANAASPRAPEHAAACRTRSGPGSTTSRRNRASRTRGGSTWGASTIGPPKRTASPFKYQTWYTKSVGWEVAGRSSPVGPRAAALRLHRRPGEVRLHAHHQSQHGAGNRRGRLLQHGRRTAGRRRRVGGHPAGQLPGARQPAAVCAPPTTRWASSRACSSATLQNNSNEVPNITYDGRWPIYGADTAVAGVDQPDAHARRAHVQGRPDAGVRALRPGALGNVRRRVQLLERRGQSEQHRLCVRQCLPRHRQQLHRGWAASATTAGRTPGRGSSRTPGRSTAS